MQHTAESKLQAGAHAGYMYMHSTIYGSLFSPSPRATPGITGLNCAVTDLSCLAARHITKVQLNTAEYHSVLFGLYCSCGSGPSSRSALVTVTGFRTSKRTHLQHARYGCMPCTTPIANKPFALGLRFFFQPFLWPRWPGAEKVTAPRWGRDCSPFPHTLPLCATAPRHAVGRVSIQHLRRDEVRELSLSRKGS